MSVNSARLNRVLVTGATGNVGSATMAALAKVGIGARAAVLDAARYRAMFPDREAVRFDFLDPTTFLPALDGVDAALLIRPPAISRVGPTLNRFLTQANDVGSKHIVFLSVAGADANRVVPHHRVETHLASLGLPRTILRPGFFANNLGDAYREDVRADNRLYVPAGSGSVAFITADDIANVVTVVAQDPAAHHNKGYTLTGSQVYTFDDAAKVLTEALGRTIRYEPATVLGYVRHLKRRGLPIAQCVVQAILHVGLRSGGAATIDPTFEALAQRPSTSLEQYVSAHVELWK